MHLASTPTRCLVTTFAPTRHAVERMSARGIRRDATDAALWYGRVVYIRGAEIYAIGRREIAFYAREGVDLTPYDGVQVVTAGGRVLTVYRNRRFRGLRR